jgi:F420-non-reducing hydrogenase iron-sulfur subunit
MPDTESTAAAPDFEPRIVAFFCNWCTYTASDLAGTARMTYEPNACVIRLMCSGRLDPEFVLAALHAGADGVLIGGCHPGDCHYREGNYKALRRFRLLRRYLDQMGIERDRVRLEWIAASEGDRVQKTMNEMTAKLRELGPLRLTRMPRLGPGTEASTPEPARGGGEVEPAAEPAAELAAVPAGARS